MRASTAIRRLHAPIATALTLLAREALLLAVCLLAWTVVPVLLGMTATTVMSDSMAPGIRAGDVVIARPVVGADVTDGRVRIGSVLLVTDPDRPDRDRLHRWVGTRDGQLVLRGDANSGPDSSPVRPAAVHAVGFLRIPCAGLPAYWLRTGRIGPLVVLAGAVLLALDLAFPRRRGDGPKPPAGRRARRLLPAALAAGTGLAVLVAPSAGAVFTKVTLNSGNKFVGGAFDCPARTGSDFPTPSLYYSYMGDQDTPNYNSTVESDLSGNGATGALTVSSRRTGTCASGSSPYVSLSGGQLVVQSAPAAGVAAPSDFGVATWFRTTTPGGKLAGFGDKASGRSTTYDRQIYMGTDGRLTFGVQMADGTRTTCTSTSAFADGQWHLVVATYSSSARAMTMWTDSAQSACSATTSGTISGYTGFWHFGYDTLSTALWPNASPTAYFTGDLDESAVYPAVLTVANERAIFAVGH